MNSTEWYEVGLGVGQDLADSGGTAANVEAGEIGFASAKSWLDGVLDGLRKKGFDAKSIAASPDILEDLRQTTAWQDDDSYRGIIVMTDDSDITQIIVAV